MFEIFNETNKEIKEINKLQEYMEFVREENGFIQRFI